VLEVVGRRHRRLNADAETIVVVDIAVVVRRISTPPVAVGRNRLAAAQASDAIAFGLL